MTNAQANIADILRSDPTIRDLIASRKAIVPAGKLTGKSKYPAITIQEGGTVRQGSHLNISSYYIRVYDDMQWDAIRINEIGYRINKLLDHIEMELDRGRFISLSFERSLPFLEDQSLHKNYIEYQYKVESV